MAAEGYAVATDPVMDGDRRHVRLAAIGAVVTGLVAAVQGRVNGALGEAVGDGVLAAVVSLGTGLLILVVIVATRSSTRTALLRTLPEQVRGGGLRWWQLSGGLCGAFFVASQGGTIPALGVALFTVLVVAGTTGSSLLFDAVGLGPGGRRPVTAPRVIGAVGTTLAVVVAVSGRFSAGSLALAAVVVTITAGALSTFQQGINGQVAERTRDALVPTFLNFALGLVALLVALAVELTLLGHAWTAPPAPWAQPLLWLGGPCGIAFLLISAIVVRPLGILLYSLLSIAGQLVGALALDVALPTTGTVVGWQLVLGVVLTFAAVAVTAVRR